MPCFAVSYTVLYCTIGGVYKCNPDTVIKAKVGTDGKLGASVKQSLEKKVKQKQKQKLTAPEKK